jgi:hypothetical protein
MDQAQLVRGAIAQVFELRASAAADSQLTYALCLTKRLQSERFRDSYSELLSSSVFAAAALFFLEELYGDKDYSERDMQFARIAKGLASMMPASVVDATVSLAQLHALTEELDHALARRWLEFGSTDSMPNVQGYVHAWRALGRREDRQQQLDTVLALGLRLAKLTRKPGIATTLKLMRRPAAVAGLGSLQEFLEKGFGIFKDLSRTESHISVFLQAIQSKESAWIRDMYDAPIGEQTALFSKLMPFGHLKS